MFLCVYPRLVGTITRKIERKRSVRGSIVGIGLLVFEHFRAFSSIFVASHTRQDDARLCGINDRNKWEVSLKRRDAIMDMYIYPSTSFYSNLVTYLIIAQLPPSLSLFPRLMLRSLPSSAKTPSTCSSWAQGFRLQADFIVETRGKICACLY